MFKFISLCFLVLSCSTSSASELQTVDYVDINKYIGKWYSIKSLPQLFTKGCLYQTAEYDLIDSESISVLNTCVKANKIKTIKGRAIVDNPETNADLTVYFKLFWGWFEVDGDYKVLALDDDYQYVMVGGQDRKSLWIMSRFKSIPEKVMNEYLQKAHDLGFNISELEDAKF